MVFHVELSSIIWLELMDWERLCAASPGQSLVCIRPFEQGSGHSFNLIFYKKEKTCNVDSWWRSGWRLPLPSALSHSEESRIQILWEPFRPGHHVCCWSPPVEMQLINEQWADDNEEPERHQTTAGVLWRNKAQTAVEKDNYPCFP